MLAPMFQPNSPLQNPAARSVSAAMQLEVHDLSRPWLGSFHSNRGREMVRVVVLYDEAPDPERYEEHVELCTAVPGAVFRHGPVFGLPMGEPQHRYYAEFEWPDTDVVQGGGSIARVRSDRPRRHGDGREVHGRVRAARDVLGEARLALLAHGGDAFVHVGAGHDRGTRGRVTRRTPALPRAASCSARASCDGSPAASPRPAGLRPRAPAARARPRATHSETSPIRSASTPSSGSQRSRWYFAFARPQSSGHTIAA